MAFEIERKFLVKGDAWRGLVDPVRIRQGYVATKDGTTVRVRVAGDAAFLTLKDHAAGLVRHEFEYPIPPADAEVILDTMCGNLVEKNRYRIPAAEPGLVWEAVFAGRVREARCRRLRDDQGRAVDGRRV